MPVLAADIGGTNATLAILEGDEILHKERCATDTIEEFSTHINDFLARAASHGHETMRACIAVAGPVREGRAEMTNAQLVIDAKELEERTLLENVKLVNDFQALAAATQVHIETQELNTGTPEEGAAQAIIGAGTGLGKAFLTWKDGQAQIHPSEGGHASLATEHPEERVFAQELEQRNGHPAEYEDVLSGRGLEAIYAHLQRSTYQQQPEGLDAERIGRTRADNPCSAEAFKWFVRFYARCVRNYTLEVLAKGGVWIAGGIAAKNADAFNEQFMHHYTEHRKYADLLAHIPVRLITDTEASLKGAAALLEEQT